MNWGIHSLAPSGTLDVDPSLTANMFWIFRRHTGPGSGWLHPDDIAGIQAIYGAGVGSVTPLRAVPEPSAVCLAGFSSGLRLHRLPGHCTQAVSRV